MKFKNWPTCGNCGSKKVHLTTQNKEKCCPECKHKNWTNEYGWTMWCDKCNMWTDLYDTPQEAYEAFIKSEYS